MGREFIYTRKFEKEWNRLGLDEKESLTNAEKNILKRVVKSIGDELKNERSIR